MPEEHSEHENAMDGLLDRLGEELQVLIQEFDEYFNRVEDDLQVDENLADFHFPEVRESLEAATAGLGRPPRDLVMSYFRLAKVFGPQLFGSVGFDWDDRLSGAEYKASPGVPHLTEADLPKAETAEFEDVGNGKQVRSFLCPREGALRERVRECADHIRGLGRYFENVWCAMLVALWAFDRIGVENEMRRLEALGREAEDALHLWEQEAFRLYEEFPGALGHAGEILSAWRSSLSKPN